jgi:hypothetical protein
MYSLVFWIVFPLVLFAASLFIIALVQAYRKHAIARPLMTAGLSVFIISIISGALVALLA